MIHPVRKFIRIWDSRIVGTFGAEVDAQFDRTVHLVRCDEDNDVAGVDYGRSCCDID